MPAGGGGATDIGKDPTPLANSFLVLRFNFSTIEVGTLAQIERNFLDHVRLGVKDFAVRYAALADWSPALKAENPAMMIDAVRGGVRQNGLPPIYAIIDEYDNFTNELSAFTNEDVARRHFIGAERLLADDRREPDAETLAQARRYRDSLPSRPGWDHAVETAVVEVYGNIGYRWFPVAD